MHSSSDNHCSKLARTRSCTCRHAAHRRHIAAVTLRLQCSGLWALQSRGSCAPVRFQSAPFGSRV
jgi:hypothetical protein